MLCALFATLTLLLFAASANAQDSSPADAIRYLSPSAFRHLPLGVRSALEARDCRIPQPWNARTPKNVIHGAFTAAHANEWAVLCSRHAVTQILIYRPRAAAAARLVDSLRSSSDDEWKQNVGGTRFRYSRLIRALLRRQIRGWRVDVDGNAIPQPVDHDAIEDVFLEKGAEAFYHAAGRWYRQVTAD